HTPRTPPAASRAAEIESRPRNSRRACARSRGTRRTPRRSTSSLDRSQRRHFHLRVARPAPVRARFVLASPAMLPHPAHDGGEGALPPRPLMPTAEVLAEVRRRRRAPHEHRKSHVAAALVQEAIDETRLLLRAELRAPQLVEIALLDDAARGEPAARQ